MTSSNTNTPSRGQGNHAGPSVQQRLGTMIAHYINNNEEASLGPKTKDGWPADAPRALLTPWEERMAEDGHLEGLTHFLVKNPFKKDYNADVNDICDIKPYPQYRKEWDRVRELYKKGKAERKIRPAREVAPVDVELKGPSETSYTAYADDGDSTDEGDSTDDGEFTDSIDSTDSDHYTDSGRSSDSGDSTDDESDSPPPVRRSKRLADDDTKHYAGRASKRLKPSQESDSETENDDSSVGGSEAEFSESSEEETTWINTRVSSRARPVIPDTDDETDSVDPSDTHSSTSSSEEEENIRIAAHVGGRARNRRIIQDSDDDTDAASQDHDNESTDSESSDESNQIRGPLRTSRRGRPIVLDSEDSTDQSDESESSDDSSNNTDDEILNIQDTITGPVNTSGFVRRSARALAPRKHF